MKKRSRILLFALALVLLLPSSALFSVADDTEFSIDGSGFTEPSYDTSIMYFWHEGMPRPCAARPAWRRSKRS